MTLRKITDAEIAAKGVVAAPDILNGTAAENKTMFDRLVRELVAVCFNDLVDQLESLGMGDIIQTKSAEMKYLRVVSGVLQYSADGKTWSVIEGGSGGSDGEDGSDGSDGADAVSPTIEVSKIDGVTTLTITDVNGTETVEIKDGEPGSEGLQGQAGADGAAGKDGYTPVKGTDYYTETEKEELVDEVVAALPTITALDFSNWDNGSFTEALSDGTEITHTVAFDTDGVPVSIDGIPITMPG